MNIVLAAMKFAKEAHAGQLRRYTGDDYFVHLAEVAALCNAFGLSETAVCVAWLHDVIEDTTSSDTELHDRFGWTIADAVLMLSDIEKGNRAGRKAAQRERLSSAVGWIQSIKCADIASNARSIIKHDPKFAKVYVEECKALLEVMTEADRDISIFAWEALECYGK